MRLLLVSMTPRVTILSLTIFNEFELKHLLISGFSKTFTLHETIDTSVYILKTTIRVLLV